MVRRRVVVTGLVQGVWFRDTCQSRARRSGVSGWIRNRADGSVEAVFEGENDAVDALVAWCHEGPDRARVDAVEVTEQPVEGAAGFWVR
jgi:acylphosphatase